MTPIEKVEKIKKSIENLESLEESLSAFLDNERN